MKWDDNVSGSLHHVYKSSFHSSTFTTTISHAIFDLTHKKLRSLFLLCQMTTPVVACLAHTPVS